MAGRQGNRSSHPTGRRARVVSMWKSLQGQRPGAHNTYREISNNDFRVICSKREGESSEEWTRVTERDHFYSKRLNSFLFPRSYLGSRIPNKENIYHSVVLNISSRKFTNNTVFLIHVYCVMIIQRKHKGELSKDLFTKVARCSVVTGLTMSVNSLAAHGCN